ncbi:MAG: hypothetical protein DRP84_09280 [Spirochaetes bacterium]|nr:MAG: hypothetical protein DRP84_09280 [Spirochaetota bacterium]
MKRLTSVLLLIIVILIFSEGIVSCKGRYAKDTVNAFVTRDNFKNTILALELYKKEFGEYPNTLEELLQKKGITDRSIIEDAWGREYYYVKLKNDYKIFSLGADGKPFTKDDIYPPKK